MSDDNNHSQDNRRRKDAAPLSFKLEVDTSGRIEGYGSIFGNVDSYGERVLPGAYAGSLAKLRSEGRMPLLLWQHRAAEPIGKWLEASEDQLGLKLVGQFNLNTTAGKNAYEHVRHGDVNGLSVGYDEVRAVGNGKVRDLLELELFEVSVVSLPANPRARISGVKCESRADLERLLREGGLPRAAAVKVANGGWPALLSEPEPSQQPDYSTAIERLKRANDDLRRLKGHYR